jgi:hypothetical protein
VIYVDPTCPVRLRTDPMGPWVIVAICVGSTVISLIATWFGRMNIVPLEVSSTSASTTLAEKLTVQLGEWFGFMVALTGQF